jgi:hypothetical protein
VSYGASAGREGRGNSCTALGISSGYTVAPPRRSLPSSYRLADIKANLFEEHNGTPTSAPFQGDQRVGLGAIAEIDVEGAYSDARRCLFLTPKPSLIATPEFAPEAALRFYAQR